MSFVSSFRPTSFFFSFFFLGTAVVGSFVIVCLLFQVPSHAECYLCKRKIIYGISGEIELFFPFRYRKFFDIQHDIFVRKLNIVHYSMFQNRRTWHIFNTNIGWHDPKIDCCPKNEQKKVALALRSSVWFFFLLNLRFIFVSRPMWCQAMITRWTAALRFQVDRKSTKKTKKNKAKQKKSPIAESLFFFFLRSPLGRGRSAEFFWFLWFFFFVYRWFFFLRSRCFYGSFAVFFMFASSHKKNERKRNRNGRHFVCRHLYYEAAGLSFFFAFFFAFFFCLFFGKLLVADEPRPARRNTIFFLAFYFVFFFIVCGDFFFFSFSFRGANNKKKRKKKKRAQWMPPQRQLWKTR